MVKKGLETLMAWSSAGRRYLVPQYADTAASGSLGCNRTPRGRACHRL